VKGDLSLDDDTSAPRDEEVSFLVYVNSSHEYVIFDPRNSEESQVSKRTQKDVQDNEPGEFVVCLLLIALTCSYFQYLFANMTSLYSS
jgi:Uma2 family endonuclease